MRAIRLVAGLCPLGSSPPRLPGPLMSQLLPPSAVSFIAFMLSVVYTSNGR